MEPQALSVSEVAAAVRLRKQYPGKPRQFLRGGVIEFSPGQAVQFIGSVEDVLIRELLNGRSLGNESTHHPIVALILRSLPRHVRVVYDMFGGSIHRIRVDSGGTHYFNKINGHYIDLTVEQFDLYNIPVNYEPNEEMDRKYCGKNDDTAKRYQLLLERIAKVLEDM